MAKHRQHAPADEAAAHELDLYAENESSLYPMKKAIAANLKKKHGKGTYDAAKGCIAWGHWFEAAAKKYAREFASPGDWSRMFSAATRRAAAKKMERYVRESGFEV